jgi:hypothetical protein
MPAENPSRQGIVDLQGTPPPRSARLSGTPCPVFASTGSGYSWQLRTRPGHVQRSLASCASCGPCRPLLVCTPHLFHPTWTHHALILQMLVSDTRARKGTPSPRPFNPRLGGNSQWHAPGGGPHTLPSWHAQVPSLLRCCIHSGQITCGAVTLSSVWRRPRARRQLSTLLHLAHATHEIQTLPVAREIEMTNGEKISDAGPRSAHATLKSGKFMNCCSIHSPILPNQRKVVKPLMCTSATTR